MANYKEHSEWLSLISGDVSGPFLTLPVLAEVMPDGLDDLKTETVASLRAQWNSLRSDASSRRAFVLFVLRECLDYDDEVLSAGDACPEAVLSLPEYGETLSPDYVLLPPEAVSFDLDDEETTPASPRSPVMLINIYPDAELSRSIPGKVCRWSPERRMAELCRAVDCPVGLVSNGERFTLVYARRDAANTFAAWDIPLCLEERVLLRAFVTLLCKSRFFSLTEEETFAAMMLKSADRQNDVTDALGRQVRSAITEFIHALDVLDRRNGGKLLGHVPSKRIYDGALTVMMRLVFVLSAEERGLLRLGEPAYDDVYAASTLYDSLRETADTLGEDVLEARHDAWVRLLSLFRAIHGGISHELLNLPAYGGSLFDPDAYPFLEGRGEGSDWHMETAHPLPVDDRVVLHMLEALLFLYDSQSRSAVRLSFRGLGVEQIGHVYEGLLDRTAMRAAETMLGIQGRKDKSGKNAEPWIALAELEALLAQGKDALCKALEKTTGLKAAALEKMLDPAPKKTKGAAEDEQMLWTYLVRACDGDEKLAARVLPFRGLLRFDAFDRPFVALETGLFVTAGSQRRDSGTHYTPRHITETLVTATLEPHVYDGPAEGKPRAEWKLKTADELLSLKICEISLTDWLRCKEWGVAA